MCKGKKKPMNVCLGRGGEACVGFRSLRWPTCAVVGCCRPSWACVGLCWSSSGSVCPRGSALAFGGPLWACVGLHWPWLGAVGLRGPALACVGRRRVLWAFVGLRWPSLAVVGCCGPSWACVGLHWPSLGAVGLRGPALAFHGLLWTCVNLCWPSSGAVGLRRPALAFRGLSWLSSEPKRGVVGLVQPASIKRPPQLAVHAMGWACSCIKLSSSSVRKSIKK